MCLCIGITSPMAMTTSLKTVLDKCTDIEDSSSNLKAYYALLEHMPTMGTFLKNNPEYAQQIVDCIVYKVNDTEITSPADKAILRLIAHENLFLGQRTQKTLSLIMECINPTNKNL